MKVGIGKIHVGFARANIFSSYDLPCTEQIHSQNLKQTSIGMSK